MGQPAVADNRGQAASVEIRDPGRRDVIEQSAEAKRIVRPSPQPSRDRQSRRNRSIRIGERIGFQIGAAETGTREQPDVGGKLLLQTSGNAALACVASDIGGAGRGPGGLGQSDGFVEAAQPRAVEEAGDEDLPCKTPQSVTALDLTDQLELTEAGVEIGTVRGCGQIEHTRPHCPGANRTIQPRRHR